MSKKLFTIEEIQETLLDIPLHSVDISTNLDKLEDSSTFILTFEKNFFLNKLYDKIIEHEYGIKNH